MSLKMTFREKEVLVDGDFESAAGRWNQREGLDFRLEIFEEFDCQTGSLFGVVSGGAVFDRDVEQHESFSPGHQYWQNYNLQA